MSSDDTSQTQAGLFSEPTPNYPPITLEIRGPIPSFKNNKLVLPPSLKALGRALESGSLKAALAEFKILKMRRTFLITKPEFQKRMDQMVESIVSQLRCAFQTDCAQTSPGNSIQSWIASHVPEDDCWTMIPEEHISGQLVETGQEGATITIQRIK